MFTFHFFVVMGLLEGYSLEAAILKTKKIYFVVLINGYKVIFILESL